MDSQPTSSTAVLIVGAGPVGCALAIELARFGIQSIIIDEAHETLTFPRYNQYSWRSTEYLRRWGLADELRFRAFPKEIPLTCTYTTGLEGHEITRFVHRSNAHSKGGQAFSPESILWSPNLYSLPVLRRRARETGCVTFAYETRFISGHERDGSVQVVIEDTHAGNARTVEAAYVVGCDGGRSAVRKSAGLELEGRFSTDHQLAIYFQAEFPGFWERGFGVHTWILKPEVRALLVSLNGKDRWRCGPLGLTEDQVRERTPLEWLRVIFGSEVPIEVLASSPWGGHYAVVNRYRSGRTFLAGDSAHLLWPAGGFGMNTGLGDAVNLAWKLAATLQGWGGPNLLDSYEAERRPEAIQRVDGSSDTRAADSFQVSPMLGSSTPQGEMIRKKAAEGIQNSARGRQWKTNMPGTDLGHVYEDSPICLPDGSAPLPNDPYTYIQSSRPGSRAPHVELANGQSTLDWFGDGFVLVTSERPQDDALERSFQAAAVPFRTEAHAAQSLRNVYTSALTLVRPDGYVCWRSDQPPTGASAQEVIARVTGRV